MKSDLKLFSFFSPGIFSKKAETEETKEKKKKKKKEASPEEGNDGERRINYSALVDKMGGLHILSEPDEEGDQGKRSRRKR